MHFLPLQKYRLVAFWNLPNQPSSFLPSFWVEIWADSPVLEEEGTKAAGTVSLCTPEDSMVFQGPPLLPHQPPAPLSLLPWEGEHRVLLPVLPRQGPSTRDSLRCCYPPLPACHLSSTRVRNVSAYSSDPESSALLTPWLLLTWATLAGLIVSFAL